MPLTDTEANDMLDKCLGSPSGSGGLWPSTVYFGLLLAEPNSDGSGVSEPSGGSYARKGVTNNATEFPAAATREKSHANNITFVTATADWGTITHVGIFDAATSGNLLAYGPLDTPRAVNNTDTFRFVTSTSPLKLTSPD